MASNAFRWKKLDVIDCDSANAWEEANDRSLPLRGAPGDKAISFLDRDCYAAQKQNASRVSLDSRLRGNDEDQSPVILGERCETRNLGAPCFGLDAERSALWASRNDTSNHDIAMTLLPAPCFLLLTLHPSLPAPHAGTSLAEEGIWFERKRRKRLFLITHVNEKKHEASKI